MHITCLFNERLTDEGWKYLSYKEVVKKTKTMLIF